MSNSKENKASGMAVGTNRHMDVLTEIGREISTSLSTEHIVDYLYQKVNGIMDANVFWIGVANEEKTYLHFKNAKENGENMAEFSVSLASKNGIAPICFTEQREIIISNYAVEYKQFYKRIPTAPSGLNTLSIIYLPLYLKDNPIGVLSVQSFAADAYNEDQIEFLRNVSMYLTSALENARLYQSLEIQVKARTREVIQQKEEVEVQKLKIQRAHKNIALLNKINEQISSQHDVESIIATTYKNLNKLMSAEVFAIGLYQEHKKCIDFVGVMEKGTRLADKSISLSNKNSIPIICFKEQKELVINNMRKDCLRITGQPPKAHAGEVVDSLIYLPLTFEKLKLGVMSVQSFGVNTYFSHHVEMLRNIARSTAINLYKALLYEGLEDQVKERTAEILEQKELVEMAYDNVELLSVIGKDITSTLNAGEITSKVYKQVNQLMDASIFFIGVYNNESKTLMVEGAREQGDVHHSFDIDIHENRLSNICFNERREIIINHYSVDYSQYLQELPAPPKGKNPESIIYIPIVSVGDPIGVLSVQSYEKNAYDEYHIDLLRNIAIHLCSALSNAMLYENLEGIVRERTNLLEREKDKVEMQRERLEQSYAQVHMLGEIGKDIISCITIKNIISTVYDNVNRLMDASVFDIGVYKEDLNSIYFPSGIENGKTLRAHIVSLDDAQAFSTICFLGEKEIIIADMLTECIDITGKEPEAVHGEIMASLIYIPLTFEAKYIGVVTVQSFDKNAYNHQDLEFLRNIGNYISIALVNAGIYTELTGKIENNQQVISQHKEDIKSIYDNIDLISQIGRHIKSSTNIEAVIKNTYTDLNKLMDATSFGIGIYEQKSNCLAFKGYMENGKVLPNQITSVEEKRLASVCYLSEQEILINDYEKEHQLFSTLKYDDVGETPDSIMYLPLKSIDTTIGVITVQSFKKHAFKSKHLNIMRSIASYIGLSLSDSSTL